MAELVVALDLPEPKQALALARELSGLIRWVKVGLELFTSGGPELVRTLTGEGFEVFLDLKYLDIPRTAGAAVREASRLGAGMLTLHVLGGERMVQAALEGREEGIAAGGAWPRIVGVTLLTSQDSRDLPQGAGETALVLQMAEKARRWGLDGVVCSGREAPAVRETAGPKFILVTPGVRPAELGAPEGDDQRRSVTPGEAVAAGSDFLVIGRPVLRAASPRAAVQAVLDAMGKSLIR